MALLSLLLLGLKRLGNGLSGKRDGGLNVLERLDLRSHLLLLLDLKGVGGGDLIVLRLLLSLLHLLLLLRLLLNIVAHLIVRRHVRIGHCWWWHLSHWLHSRRRSWIHRWHALSLRLLLLGLLDDRCAAHARVGSGVGQRLRRVDWRELLTLLLLSLLLELHCFQPSSLGALEFS